MAEPLAPVDPEALLRSEIAQKTLDLPILPGVAAEVLATSMDSDGNASKLAALIQQDQALASNVLRIVNSPTYRGATEIVALQQAIARLGMSLIREVALSVSLKAALNQPGPYDSEVQDAWTQALAAALWSKEVARRCRKNVENAYLCGLLHNVGIPVVLHRLAAISAETSGAEPLPQTKAVPLAEEFAVDAAVMLVREWRLPELVATCLTHLNEFSGAAENSDAVAIVVVGIALARAMHESGLECEQIQQWPALVHLNLYPDEVAELVACQDHISELLLGMNGSGASS